MINNEKLHQIRILIDKDKGTEFIHPYYEERIIICSALGWKGSGKVRYSMIDMQFPDKEILYDFQEKHSFGVVENLFSSYPDKNNYLGIRIYSSLFKESELTWVNLSNMETNNDSENKFNNIKVSGFPSALTDGNDCIMLKMMNFGEIYKTINSNISFKLNWTIPKDLLKYEKDTIVLFVNNNYMRVISLWNEMDVNKQEENRPLIHDKVNNRWYYETLPGSFRAFGKWIAGYVCYPNKENKIIPGKDMRKNEDEEDSEYGLSFDWRAFFKETYAPGIVYLYDVQTRRRIEMDTGQGDSEILLVDGDDVYYRVYDAIYKVKITDDGITGKTLLVQEGEIVPHIHWAFIGP